MCNCNVIRNHAYHRSSRWYIHTYICKLIINFAVNRKFLFKLLLFLLYLCNYLLTKWNSAKNMRNWFLFGWMIEIFWWPIIGVCKWKKIRVFESIHILILQQWRNTYYIHCEWIALTLISQGCFHINYFKFEKHAHNTTYCAL